MIPRVTCSSVDTMRIVTVIYITHSHVFTIGIKDTKLKKINQSLNEL